MLWRLGFGDKWCKWINSYFYNLCDHDEWGSVFVKPSKRLRKDDSLSSLLFIIVIETVNKMLLRATKKELFKGLKVDKGEHMEEVIHIFFVDDTLVPYELDEMVILNIICILLSFPTISRLIINLAKSKLVKLDDEMDVFRLARVIEYKSV